MDLTEQGGTERSRPAPEAAEIILSEQVLRVRTETVPTERIRLEKFIVTEERTITVTVSREEVRLSRESIPNAAPLPHDNATERDPIIVILHEEQLVVTKTVVPVERVTLTVTDVTETQRTVETLDREQIGYQPG